MIGVFERDDFIASPHIVVSNGVPRNGPRLSSPGEEPKASSLRDSKPTHALVPGVGDGKSDSTDVRESSLREVAEGTVAGLQRRGGGRVTHEGSSEGHGSGSPSRSRVARPPECYSLGCLTAERRALVQKMSPDKLHGAPPSRARSISRRQSEHSRSRTAGLLTAVALSIFFLNYCVGGRRSSQGAPVLSRLFTASSNTSLMRRDTPFTAGMSSSRKLANRETPPPFPPPPQVGTAEACDSALRALSSHMATEADGGDRGGPRRPRTGNRQDTPSTQLAFSGIRFFFVGAGR